MADFVIGDVRQVREFSWVDMANIHLADGWVLLLVRDGQETDHNPVTGDLETVPTTVYVIGWIGEDQPKNRNIYEEELREATRGAAGGESDF